MAHEPTEQTRQQVKTLSGYGATQEQIGKVMGVHPDTLRKYYSDELATGTIEANAQVAQSLFKKAIGSGHGSVTAAIFWMKTRGGWREVPQEIEVAVSTPDSVPPEKRAKAIAVVMAKAAKDKKPPESDGGDDVI